MLYVLGLSYGAVALALEALGHPLSKTAVYNAVQAAGERVPGLRRDAVRMPVGQGVAALGADLTSVKCRGQWLTVGVAVDAVHGVALTIAVLESGEGATLTPWIGEIAALVGATVLVTDDADSFKIAADETGLTQQVCTAHVVRNTDAWVERMTPELVRDADGSLAAIGVEAAQAVVDGEALRARMRERQPTAEARTRLQAIHRRDQGAMSPRQARTETMSLADKFRLFRLDRWNPWGRLTRYRTWVGPEGDTLDGTNHATERAIGWWVKERYRTMRGYKRPVSIHHVSRLIAWAGNQLAGSAADLAEVVPYRHGGPGAPVRQPSPYQALNSHRESVSGGCGPVAPNCKPNRKVHHVLTCRRLSALDRTIWQFPCDTAAPTSRGRQPRCRSIRASIMSIGTRHAGSDVGQH